MPFLLVDEIVCVFKILLCSYLREYRVVPDFDLPVDPSTRGHALSASEWPRDPKERPASSGVGAAGFLIRGDS